MKGKEMQEKETRDKEVQDKEIRGKEIHDKEVRDTETQDNRTGREKTQDTEARKKGIRKRGAGTKKEKEPGLEENFRKLDEILEKMGEEDLSLEEAFSAYTEGMELLLKCNEQIDRVEKQVMKLNVNGELEEFENGHADF